ncbi:PROX2 protein, partial [Nothoprocta ornata]|nr:PROX2 protein [Nothoprocta ornata]
DDREQLSDEHLRAKRARVESIIQGMNLPPNAPTWDSGGESGGGHELERGRETPRESKRKPRLPLQQQQSHGGLREAIAGACSSRAESCQQLKEQLRTLEQQLRQLQERFLQLCGPGEAAHAQEGTEQAHPARGAAAGRAGKGGAAELQRQVWRSAPEAAEAEEAAGSTGGPSSQAALLSETLKLELAAATARVVDSVLEAAWPKAAGRLPQRHRSLPVPAEGARREHLASGKGRKPLPEPPRKDVPDSPGGAQAEALSGASEKSPDSHPGPVGSRGLRKPCQVAGVGYPLGTTGPAQDNQLLGQLRGCGQHGPWGSSSHGSPSAAERGPPEPLDLHWAAIKLRSAVVRQQQLPVPPLPQVKAQGRCPWQAVGRLSLTRRYIQEALSPGHLKKAKLMFFFTRYPSSTLLKSYFLDVQFSRCITSQLIKWFSNFREFYYIQVEKFARQALLEGAADAGALRVSRDSELFRALNTHYNKGNDFEVPARFLEVASLTLQEFFSAVRAGKDSDPSWKKPIYKIISKLDSDIPEAFKSSGCSQELLRS